MTTPAVWADDLVSQAGALAPMPDTPIGAEAARRLDTSELFLAPHRAFGEPTGGQEPHYPTPWDVDKVNRQSAVTNESWPQDLDGWLLAYEPSVVAVWNQVHAMASLDSLRQTLGLSVADAARLTGASTRRFYEWKRGEPMPRQKLAATLVNIDLVSRLVRQNLEAACALFAQEEALDLVAEQKVFRLQEEFRRKQAELRAAKAAWQAPTTAAVRPAAAAIADVRQSMGSSAVRTAVGALGRLIPWLGLAEEGWRIDAAGSVEAETGALEAGDALSTEWAFLALMKTQALEQWHQEALRMLAEPTVGPPEWKRFIGEAEERATAEYTNVLLEPIVELDGEDGDAFPAAFFDLTTFAIDVSTGRKRDD